MNALHPLAVYAAVQAHKGETLQYPGAYENWLATGEHSTAYLTSYLSEWAVLEDKCKNQKFNASDTCHIANNRLWPEVARWYGTSSVSEPVLDESQITTLQPPPGPTPVGYGPTAKIRFAWSMQSWAAEEVNQKVRTKTHHVRIHIAVLNYHTNPQATTTYFSSITNTPLPNRLGRK